MNTTARNSASHRSEERSLEKAKLIAYRLFEEERCSTPSRVYAVYVLAGLAGLAFWLTLFFLVSHAGSVT